MKNSRTEMKYLIRDSEKLNKHELIELKAMSLALDGEMQNLYAKLGLQKEDNSLWEPPVNRTVIFSVVNEVTVGFIEYAVARNDVVNEFFLSKIYVKPEHRRKGHAKSLVTEAIRHIKEITGLKDIFILGSIVSNNTASQKLFGDMGRTVYSDNFYFKA